MNVLIVIWMSGWLITSVISMMIALTDEDFIGGGEFQFLFWNVIFWPILAFLLVLVALFNVITLGRKP